MVLTGLIDGHAESIDGEWSVPASWILDDIDADETFWHHSTKGHDVLRWILPSGREVPADTAVAG